MRFSIAAASRSLEKLMPTASPATYAILSVSCLLYIASLMATVRTSGLQLPAGGGLSALFSLGSIDGRVLLRFGMSAPLPYNLLQPWRFVMAVFLHSSLAHIVFNMWVLMDFGPVVEEAYGSARYFFIYVVTGIGGYVLSSAFGHFSVGGSGAVLGICGVIFAITAGSRSFSHQMLRSQVIRILIYVAVLGLLPLGGFIGRIDNFAHIGGFVTGFGLGKIMMDRPPVAPGERKRAYILGWSSVLALAVSFAITALLILRPPR